MIIKGGITLYSVPIDSTYANVFDGYAHIDNYISFLDNNFLKVEVPVYQKSININKKIELQIQLENNVIPVIQNLNYCRIDVDALYQYFYFIDSYKIENSVNNKVSVILYCSWDVWTNNYLDIKNYGADEFIETRHMDNYSVSVTEEQLISCINNNYITDEDDCRTVEKHHSIPSYNYDLNNFEVLYQRFFFNGEATFNAFQYSSTLGIFAIDTETQKYGVITTTNPVKVAYIPIAVINRKTNEINYHVKDYIVKFTHDSYTQVEKHDLFLAKHFRPYSIDEPELIYSDITFLSPFEYYVDLLNNQLVFGLNTGTIYGNDYSNYYGTVKCSSGSSYYSFVNVKTELDHSFLFNISVQEKKYYSPSYIKNLITSNSKDNRYTFEPQMYVYPYCYYSLRLGDTKIDLVGEYGTKEVNCKLYLSNTTSPKLFYKNDNNESYNARPIFISNKGQMLTQINSLKEFMQSNSYQINAQKVSNGLNLAVSALGTIIGGPVGTATALTANASYAKNRINIYAKQKDADNRIDSTQIPSIYSTDDFMFQDSIFITKTEIEDEKDKDRILDKFVLYGVDIENYGDVFENSRFNFDYVKTRNCELRKILINNEDKLKLRNIFNSGVRKWHITGFTNAVKNLDTNYVNIQMSLKNVADLL